MGLTKCITFLGALLLLGVALPAEACRCLLVDHPQWRFCNSDAVVETKFLRESTRGPTSTSSETQIGFDCETIKVLKGDNGLQTSTFIHNYMADTSCKYGHSEDGYNKAYLVMGINKDGNVGVMGCSFVKQWSDLTPKQISGVQGAYTPGCKTCEISNCNSQPCEQKKDTCILEEYVGGGSKNQKENQACLRSEKGVCAWKTIQ